MDRAAVATEFSGKDDCHLCVIGSATGAFASEAAKTVASSAAEFCTSLDDAKSAFSVFKCCSVILLTPPLLVTARWHSANDF
jgi:hypothetical protein